MSTELRTTVEQTDAGWTVVMYVDGERRELDSHPTEEKARLAAESIEGAATRYDDAAEVDEADG